MSLLNWFKGILNKKIVPNAKGHTLNKWERWLPLFIGIVVGILFAIFWNAYRDTICQTLGIGEILFYLIGKVGTGVIGAIVTLAGYLIENYFVFGK